MIHLNTVNVKLMVSMATRVWMSPLEAGVHVLFDLHTFLFCVLTKTKVEEF